MPRVATPRPMRRSSAARPRRKLPRNRASRPRRRRLRSKATAGSSPPLRAGEEWQGFRGLVGISGEAMGQKVHPYGFRLGYTKPWKSRWFVEKDYDKLLLEDYKLKTELKEKLKSAGVSSVEIERPGNKLRIIIKTARPGIIIGRKGAEIDKLKQDLQKRLKSEGSSREVHVDIQEVHKPELDAQLVSESIALQLEKRVGFRRAMRKSVDS